MRDFFYKRKLQEKESEIDLLNAQIDSLKMDIRTLKQKYNGERMCGNHCALCKHGIKNEIRNAVFGWNDVTYTCKLNVKCKDFCEV